MNLNTVFISTVLTLLSCLLIFYNSPSEKYIFDTKPKHIFVNNAKLNTPASLNFKFTDLTFQSGLFFAHQQGDHHISGINESLGSGACALDYDNDGWQDLFIVNGSGQTRFYGKPHWWQEQNTHQLFKNTGGLNFVNVTKDAGLPTRSWGMGCVAADFNNDGLKDLFITNLGVNQLFKNEGKGYFTEVKNFTTDSNSAWSTSACVADFDGDSLVDLYISNYIDFDKTKLNYEAQSEFSTATSEFFSPALFTPEPNRLYKNTGNFKFVNITENSGLTDNTGRSLTARCQDINNDHLPDIIVGNDKGDGSNKLYINQGQLSFIDSTKLYRFQNNSGTQSIVTGDIDNDSKKEIMLSSGKMENLRLYQGDLSKNQTSNLTDHARLWGLADNISNFQSNWGSGLHDFNQDGLLDFFVVNGLLTPDPDVHRVAKGQPNQLWLNTGQQFLAISPNDPRLPNLLPEPSRSSVFADFDNDGDMDIYITHNNNPGQLLVNQIDSKFHWLGVQLIDHVSKQDMTGAQVSITSSAGIQSRSIVSGDSFLSDSEDRLLFGLENDTLIKQLTVIWPDGKNSIFNDIDIDRYVLIDVNKGLLPYPHTDATKQSTTIFPSNNPKTISLLLSLLSDQKDLSKALPYFRKALTLHDAKVRKTAIKQLAKFNVPASAALLINTIQDQNKETAVLALDTLCAFEQETTVRWLIGALSDKRDPIRKAAAHCFETLFHEEEAVIHRKFLALPPLIHLLNDSNSEIQIAAAKALAEAEHNRAISPLISLLSSANSDVTAEAVKSLGLIRDKVAIPHLLKLLQNSDETFEVIAQSLIALKRLGYKNFNDVFTDFFLSQPPFDQTSLQLRSNILVYLSENIEDSIVINPKTLSNQAAKLIINNPTNYPLILQLINILDASNKEHASLLIQLTHSPNQNVRLNAFISIITGQPDKAITFTKQVAQDSSALVKNKFLQGLSNHHIHIPVEEILPFLTTPNTTISAISLLETINNRNSARLLSTVLSKSPHPILILKALENNKYTPPDIAEPFLNSDNQSLKKAAYHYYLPKLINQNQSKTMPDIFFTALNKETPAIRTIALRALTEQKSLWAIKKLQNVIFDINEESAIRLSLLKKFNHPFQKKWRIMLKIANNAKDPIRYPVSKLLTAFNAPQVIDFFKSLVLSSESDNKLNLLAYNALANKDPAWALKALSNHPIH